MDIANLIGGVTLVGNMERIPNEREANGVPNKGEQTIVSTWQAGKSKW